MEFAVLGPLQIRGSSGPIDLAGGKERTLLAHLVARAGRVVSTDELIDSLWPNGPPRTATKSLQTFVLRIRNVLEPERGGSPQVLVREGGGYRLMVTDQAVDAGRFTRLAQLGRRAYEEGRLEAAATTLREALGLWRGPAYLGFEAAEFAGAERRRLDELRLMAVEDRIAADIDLGRAQDAIPDLESLVHQHPLRERLWQLLLLALYRAGRQADALGAYSRIRQILVGELGVEPGEALRELHSLVLAQDASLLATSAAPAVPPGLRPPPGPFVGREYELTVLRNAWARVCDGTAVTVMIRGPSGAGARRLASEFAVEVAARGGRVAWGSVPDLASTGPTLVVVANGADVAAEGSRRLTVMLARASADPPPRSVVLDLAPLTGDNVRGILSSYFEDSAVDEMLPRVLRESGGRPGRVHAVAFELARRRAAARVGEATAWAGDVHRALETARDELREGVTEFRELVERHDAPATDVCPWKGLVEYGVADAPWFAGRERLVAELLVRLASARLVGVVGASGSGKSSLVRAGLLASLSAGALPGSEGWNQMVMRPGTQPIRELARTLLNDAEPGQHRVPDLLEQLVFGPDAPGRTVIVIDQLEELWAAPVESSERRAFLDALGDIVESDSRCTVVVVLRADFVDRLADQPVLARAMSGATLLVGAPSEAEVRRAVERPAARAGLELDVGLADAIVADAAREPGALPLLSTAMADLWERRSGARLTLGTYVAAAGIRGAVARIAERAYGELDRHERAAARTLLLRLAGPGEGGAAVRRRVPLAELDTLEDGRVSTVVEPLARARLLTVAAGHVEVAHEALFREWPRLRDWLEEDEAGRRLRQHLAPAAEEWRVRGRDDAELYRGPRLAAVVEWVREHRPELTETEREFIAASRTAAEAEAVRRRGTVRRLRLFTAGLAVMLVLVTVAAYVAASQREQADAAALAADARALRAEALSTPRWDLTLLYNLQAYRLEPSGKSRSGLLAALQRSPAVVGVIPVESAPSRLAISPDGRTVAGGDWAGTVYVWDAASRRRIATVHRGPDDGWNVLALSFSPDGRTLVVSREPGGNAGGKAPITLLDLGTTPPTSRVALAGSGALMALFSPDGTGLITLFRDGTLGVVDVDTGAVRRRMSSGLGPPDLDRASPDLFVSPDGRFVVGRTPERHGVVWDLTTDRIVGEFPPERHIMISPDGGMVAFRVDDDTVGVRDLATGRERFVAGDAEFGTRDLTSSAGGVAWAPDGATFATMSLDGAVRIWNPADLTVRATLRGHAAAVVALHYAPDGRLYSSGGDGVFVWDPSRTRRLAEDFPVDVDVSAAADGRFTADGRLLLWVHDGALEFEVTRLTSPAEAWSRRTTLPPDLRGDLHDVGLASGGRRAAFLTVDENGVGRVAVWDVATEAFLPGRIRFDAGGDAAMSPAIALSPDGETLYVGDRTGVVRAYATASGAALGEVFRTAGRPVQRLSSPSGDTALAVSTGAPGTDTVDRVDVVDPRDGRRIARVPVPSDLPPPAEPVLSPSGHRLVVGLASGEVIVWDTVRNRQVSRHPVTEGVVTLVVITPDGRHVMAWDGADGSARWWPIDGPPSAGLVLNVGATDRVFSAFRDGGRRIVTVANRGKPLLWDIEDATLVRVACDIVRRDLTQEEWAAVLPDRDYEPTCTG